LAHSGYASEDSSANDVDSTGRFACTRTLTQNYGLSVRKQVMQMYSFSLLMFQYYKRNNDNYYLLGYKEKMKLIKIVKY